MQQGAKSGDTMGTELSNGRGSNERLRTRESMTPIITAFHQVVTVDMASPTREHTPTPALGELRLAPWKKENINVIRRYVTQCPPGECDVLLAWRVESRESG